MRTVAVSGGGIDDLKAAVAWFREAAGTDRRARRRRERAEMRLTAILAERLLARVRRDAFPGGDFGRLVDEIAARGVDPYTAPDWILDRLEFR